jgi:hypothetical protein
MPWKHMESVELILATRSKTLGLSIFRTLPTIWLIQNLKISHIGLSRSRVQPVRWYIAVQSMSGENRTRHHPNATQYVATWPLLFLKSEQWPLFFSVITAESPNLTLKSRSVEKDKYTWMKNPLTAKCRFPPLHNLQGKAMLTCSW